MAEKVKLSKDGSSIDFVPSESIPTSLKKFRQSPDIEGFYRFIFENDLQKEVYDILDRIIAARKAAKSTARKEAKAQAAAAAASVKAATQPAPTKVPLTTKPSAKMASKGEPPTEKIAGSKVTGKTMASSSAKLKKPEKKPVGKKR